MQFFSFSPTGKKSYGGSRGKNTAVHDKLPCLLAFFIPFVLMLGIIAGNQIYPFGDNCFLRMDMYHQYAPFFSEFSRILKEGRSLFYTFQVGLGSNFSALFAYYLSSPFNWLIFIVPSGFVLEFMTFLIVLKIALCGLTMAWYLRKRFDVSHLGITFFAVCYAMSGYIAAYNWNIMWLDCLWLAPLILLGLERLVKENRPGLYAVCLSLAIICNYYISIMLCLFLVLYFICELIILPRTAIKEYLTKCGLFALFSLLAGGVAGIILIPTVHALMTTASADSTFPQSLTSYFSILEMLSRHMMTVESEVGLDHWPNLYSGVACFLLLPTYLMNPETKTREKIVRVCLLFFMLLSFNLNIPNYIWHGFHYPNSLPCRQSFLYTIVLLAMCFEGLRGLRHMTQEQLLRAFWISAAFILICEAVVSGEEIEYYACYLSLLFVAFYALTAYQWKRSKIKTQTALILALALVIVETGINMAATSVTTVDRTEYWKNTVNYQKLLEKADESDTSGFYRTEKYNRRTKNDSAWTDYASASLFSSTTQASLSDFYKMFGMEGSTNAFSFTGATPLMASVLSVRYMLSPTDVSTDSLTRYVGWEDTTHLYENLYTLPVGFLIPNDVSDYFSYYSGNPVDAQNSLVNLTAGTGSVLEEITTNHTGTSFTYTAEESSRLFVLVENSKIEDVSAKVGNEHKSFSNVNRGYLLDLGSVTQGESITLDSDQSETMEVTIYRFNEENFLAWYETMNRYTMTVTDHTDTRKEFSITGTVTVPDNNQMLFTSIPYEDGWTVTVDGEKVEASSFADAFLCLNLTAGEHTITMSYHTPGLGTGIILSLVSLALMILALKFWDVYLRKQRRKIRMAKKRQISQAEQNLERIRMEENISGLETDTMETTSAQNDSIEEILLEDEEFLEEPDSLPK
ncbi:MAG: YfhO family protein [Clostridiales bacterium]|nr:YfhO family protein [Clostridiales bacterium]